jgi:histidyl-tRNA synthetase
MQHQQLSFPFKRYQLQPVWRADRPQKGRYREFYQCDADVVGSRSLLNEVELIQIYLSVFERLNLDVEIRINHRKILAGLAAVSGGPDRLIPITTAIDKLDKIGLEKVKQELAGKNLSENQIATIQRYLEIRSSGNEEKLMEVEKILGKEAFGTSINSPAEKPHEEEVDHSLQQGIQDIRKLLVFFPGSKNLVVDLSLARGLNYDTGIIFEVRAKNVNIGSIGGGGRYDDLTGLFGVPGIPGVGISFGVDRIYDVMEELKLFPGTVSRSSEFLFFNLGTDSLTKNLALSQLLRKAGIRCELYPEQAKFDKQFKYAEKKKIPFVVLIGAEELKTGRAKIKNLSTGIQEECGFGEIVDYAGRVKII